MDGDGAGYGLGCDAKPSGGSQPDAVVVTGEEGPTLLEISSTR